MRSLVRAVTMGGLEAAVSALPPGRQLELRQATRLTVPLDYPGVRIRAETPMELVRSRGCAKEPETVAWLQQTFRPGDVLYDVGANVGAYSLVASVVAHGQCQVLAFEPSPETFAALAENVRLNGASVTALPVGLSDRTGLQRMGGRTDAGASNHEWGGEGTAVMCYSLDDLRDLFALPDPTHLKIDVDGCESAVVAGSAVTLRLPELRTVLIEAKDGCEGRDTVAEIQRRGFRIVGTYPRGGRLVNWILERN